ATLTQTPGPATNVAIQFQTNPIVANGTSTTSVTATVTDANGNQIPGHNVQFSSSDTGIHFSPSPATDNGDGTYTATPASSTTVGKTTITATDGSLSGHATLTLAAGHATNVSVRLAPIAIPANHVASSRITVTVNDAHGHPLPGQRLTLSGSDKGL